MKKTINLLYSFLKHLSRYNKIKFCTNQGRYFRDKSQIYVRNVNPLNVNVLEIPLTYALFSAGTHLRIYIRLTKSAGYAIIT